MIKNVLKAQKGEQSTITGNKITLTDNVFTPELVMVLQGGTITTDPPGGSGKITKYEPPVAGSAEKEKYLLYVHTLLSMMQVARLLIMKNHIPELSGSSYFNKFRR